MNIAGLASAIVGATFVYAGVSKLLAGREWPRAARALGVPAVVAHPVTFAEIVVGLGVVLGDSWRGRFLAAAALMLGAFTVLLAVQLRRGIRPPCACFGGASQRPIGARDVVRNASLLALVFVAFLS
jgi:hypothetical protein